MIEFNEAFQVSPAVIQNLKVKFCDSCKICGGTRRIASISDTNRTIKPCSCLIAFQEAFKLASANIPESLMHLTAEDMDSEFKVQNAAYLERVLLYIANLPSAVKDGFGLYLYGDNGSGKSFISTLIVKQALKKGYSAYFILLKDLIDVGFDSLMNPDIKQDLSTLITQIDFLVIDELDSVQSDIHPSVQSLLTSLLKKRSYSNKPLIVTATTPRDGIKYTLGTTIYSTFSERLSEIVFVGDYRKQLRQNLEDKYFNNGN